MESFPASRTDVLSCSGSRSPNLTSCEGINTGTAAEIQRLISANRTDFSTFVLLPADKLAVSCHLALQFLVALKRRKNNEKGRTKVKRATSKTQSIGATSLRTSSKSVIISKVDVNNLSQAWRAVVEVLSVSAGAS